MATKLKLLVGIAFAINAAVQASAQGYIVPNGVTVDRVDPVSGIIIHVVQNPLNGDYTGFTLPPRIRLPFSSIRSLTKESAPSVCR